MHPALGLWIVGLGLIIASWYIPNSGGYLALGVVCCIVGTVFGLRSGR